MTRKAPKCPQCDSDNVVRIVFGYPTEEVFELADRGEVALGGCCVTEEDPKWHCKACEYDWA